MLMKKGRGSSNFLKLAKACSKAMKLLARCSSMLLNSVQLFLNLAQFGFQIFQTFAQNCLKLGAAGMTGNGQDVSCEKYCVCSANDAAAAHHDGRKKGAASHDDRSIQKRGRLLSTFIISNHCSAWEQMKKWILWFSMGWGHEAEPVIVLLWFEFVHEGAEFKLRFASCTSGSTIMELERLSSSKPNGLDELLSYCNCLHGKNERTTPRSTMPLYALTPERSMALQQAHGFKIFSCSQGSCCWKTSTH